MLYEEKVIRNMRHRDWAKAKGYLIGILSTFWNDHPNYYQLKEVIEKFIKEVEDNGLHD